MRDFIMTSGYNGTFVEHVQSITHVVGAQNTGKGKLCMEKKPEKKKNSNLQNLLGPVRAQ